MSRAIKSFTDSLFGDGEEWWTAFSCLTYPAQPSWRSVQPQLKYCFWLVQLFDHTEDEAAAEEERDANSKPAAAVSNERTSSTPQRAAKKGA